MEGRRLLGARAELDAETIRAARESFRRPEERRTGGSGSALGREAVNSGHAGAHTDKAALIEARNNLFRLASEASAQQAAELRDQSAGKTPVSYGSSGDGNRLKIGDHVLFFDAIIKSPDELLGVAARNLAKALSTEGLDADEIFQVVGAQVDDWRAREVTKDGSPDAVLAEVSEILAQRKQGRQPQQASLTDRVKGFFRLRK